MTPKVLGIGGALILVATAALHLSGFRAFAAQLDGAALPEFWQGAMKSVWVYFSVQLVIIAAAVAAQFVQPPPLNRAVLVVCLALLVGNVVVLALWLGAFIGTVAIAVAALAIGSATALQSRAPNELR